MATGFVQRWKGKVMAAALYLGPGGIVDAASGIGGKVQLANKTAITVTAVANTDFSISLPPGATILSANFYTTTAFTGTTVTAQLGSTLGALDIVAATNIKAAGYVLLVLAATAPASIASEGTAPNVFCRVIQTGPTAVGAGLLVIEYA
jgi:hypothetical protein